MLPSSKAECVFLELSRAGSVIQTLARATQTLFMDTTEATDLYHYFSIDFQGSFKCAKLWQNLRCLAYSSCDL